MPIIKPAGLLSGERINALTLTARLHWPFLYCASNGYGRFLVDYASIIQRAYCGWAEKPSEEELRSVLLEYKDKHLLFLYQAADGAVWGAWDCASGQRWFNAEDKKSPEPPEPAFEDWKAEYRRKKGAEVKRRPTSLGAQIPLSVEPLQTTLGFNEDSASKSAILDVENTSFGVDSGPKLPFSTSKTRVSTSNLHRHNTTQHNVLNTNTTQHSLKTCENQSRRVAKKQRAVFLAEWAQTVYERHPKKRYKREAVAQLVARFWEDEEARLLFDVNHASWCTSRDWRSEPQFVPPLADKTGGGWIADDGWKHPPPGAKPPVLERHLDGHVSTDDTAEAAFRRAQLFREGGFLEYANAEEERARALQHEATVKHADTG